MIVKMIAYPFSLKNDWCFHNCTSFALYTMSKSFCSHHCDPGVHPNSTYNLKQIEIMLFLAKKSLAFCPTGRSNWDGESSLLLQFMIVLEHR